jgi:hypothetical protein
MSFSRKALRDACLEDRDEDVKAYLDGGGEVDVVMDKESGGTLLCEAAMGGAVACGVLTIQPCRDITGLSQPCQSSTGLTPPCRIPTGSTQTCGVMSQG